MTYRGFTIAVIAFLLLLAGSSMTRAGWPQSDLIQPLDLQSPITYFIADGSGVPGYRSSDRELAQWALEAWQRTSPKSLHFEPSPEASALVRLYWAGPDGGEFGEMRPLSVGGRRGAAVFIRPDLEALGPELARNARADDLLRDSVVYLTCVHELGHAVGLTHTRDFRDIMYFFGYGGDIVEFFGRYRVLLHARDDISHNAGLSTSDVERMKSMYGRE
jgi:hypothetical protein